MADEQKIEVGSYMNTAVDGALKGRLSSLWGFAALGLLLGAGVGLLAPFIPTIAGLFVESLGGVATINTALTLIPHSMAVFGATGMVTGFAAGGVVGAPAGAIAATAKEIEKRSLEREQQVGKTLGVSMPPPPVAKTYQNNERYFNPKVSALFAGLGAVAGAVLAAGFFAPSIIAGGTSMIATSAFMPAIETVLGASLAGNVAAVTSYSIGVMGIFGALCGVNFPKMAVATRDFTGRLLSGELLGTSWKKEPQHSLQISNDNQIIAVKTQPEQSQAIEHSCMVECKTNHVAKLGGSKQPINSYKDMVIKGKEAAMDMASDYISV